MSLEIFNKMVDALPESLNKKGYAFYLSNDIYVNLCIELKRIVKSYKGYKINANRILPKDYAVLTKKIKELHQTKTLNV